jgi:hypothetical protein
MKLTGAAILVSRGMKVMQAAPAAYPCRYPSRCYMRDVTEIEIYRDGGTLEFRLDGSEIDGFYRLQTPFGGVPEPLFRDGTRLDFGSKEDAAVLGALESWLQATMTPDLAGAIAELVALREWRNLPARLSDVVPIRYIHIVAGKLRERCGNRTAALKP